MSVAKGDIKASYPLPVYNYRVSIGDLAIGVSEISGLSVGYELVTYQHGLSFIMGDKLIPGMSETVKLTMKRGIAQKNEVLTRWFADTYAASSKSTTRDILIDLCDEAGAPIVSWKVQGALPVKIDAPTFDANSNEVAIETIEIIAQGIEIEYR